METIYDANENKLLEADKIFLHPSGKFRALGEVKLHSTVIIESSIDCSQLDRIGESLNEILNDLKDFADSRKIKMNELRNEILLLRKNWGHIRPSSL